MSEANALEPEWTSLIDTFDTVLTTKTEVSLHFKQPSQPVSPIIS